MEQAGRKINRGDPIEWARRKINRGDPIENLTLVKISRPTKWNHRGDPIEWARRNFNRGTPSNGQGEISTGGNASKI